MSKKKKIIIENIIFLVKDKELSFTNTNVTVKPTNTFDVIGVNKKGVEVLNEKRAFSDRYSFETFSINQLLFILTALIKEEVEIEED